MQVKPFVISVPDAAVTDLNARLSRTRWPDQIDGIGWEQGTDRAYLEDIINYWQAGFDWRAQEAALNRFAQFRATIGDHHIHFVHERARSGNGIPLIITHGWPGSFAEMLKIIPMLTDRNPSKEFSLKPGSDKDDSERVTEMLLLLARVKLSSKLNSIVPVIAVLATQPVIRGARPAAANAF